MVRCRLHPELSPAGRLVRDQGRLMASEISGATLEKARRELNEDPDTRLEKIEELRSKIEAWEADPDDPDTQGLSFPVDKVQDDKFLLRFLRTKKFEVDRACTLFVNYHKFRRKHASLLGEITPEAAEPTLKAHIVAVLPERTRDGCKVLLVRAGLLDLEQHPLENIVAMVLVILDHLIEDEETQVHGIVVCEDLAALTFLQMMSLIRKEQVAKGIMMELFQDAFPARFKGFHIVNQPWYISLFMAVVRPFMKQKTKDRFHMHGADYESLYEFLPPEHLPADFGGQLETLDTYSAYYLFQH